MSENLIILPNANREEQYKSLLPQIKALLGNEKDEIANLANLAAALKEAFHFFWVGFYLVREDELVLGPFQGPVACTRIQYGKGVCGTAWMDKKAIIVPDVEQFPGHIACNSLSKSELVLPLFREQSVWGVLDIDSDQLNDFNKMDAFYLNKMLELLP